MCTRIAGLSVKPGTCSNRPGYPFYPAKGLLAAVTILKTWLYEIRIPGRGRGRLFPDSENVRGKLRNNPPNGCRQGGGCFDGTD